MTSLILLLTAVACSSTHLLLQRPPRIMLIPALVPPRSAARRQVAHLTAVADASSGFLARVENFLF